MPISTVLITNTIDFARQVVNQISANINAILGTSGAFTTTGNVIVNPANTTLASVNVANGTISGNGFNLFSISVSGITLNQLRNSQLQNSFITVNATTGLNGGGQLILGQSSLSVNIVPVDSFSNTRTDIAVAANSFVTANALLSALAINANLVNSGTLSTSVGGLGRSSYSVDGQILIGTTEGSLTTNTVRPGIGLSASYGPGSISFSANLIQGTNTTITSGSQVSVNAPPVATTTSLGIVRLDDTTTCTDITLAATANTINAVRFQAASKFTAVAQDMSGRLLEYRIFSTPGTFTWTKPANTAYVDITVIGGGGGGAGVGPGGSGVNYGSGGFAGAMLVARIANTNCNSTCTLTIGYAGNSTGLQSGGRVGFRGQNTVFSMGTGNTQLDYYANGGNGGLVGTDYTFGGNVITWQKWADVGAGKVTLATARGPTSGAPQPEWILTMPGAPPEPLIRLNRGNTIGSMGGSVPGKQLGGWTSFSVNVSQTGGSVPTTYGPDGNTAAVASNGSGWGGAGGGGGFNETSGGSGTTYVSGASGANGVIIIQVYS